MIHYLPNFKHIELKLESQLSQHLQLLFAEFEKVNTKQRNVETKDFLEIRLKFFRRKCQEGLRFGKYIYLTYFRDY